MSKMETESRELEASEQEAEIVNTTPAVDSKIDAIIELAEQTESLGKALDKIRKFVLARALPGDFVVFKGQGDSEGHIELVGAGAGRIMADLGISFVDWRDWKEQEGDGHYRWWYSCTTLFKGRRYEQSMGHAGSRDKFFGYANGAWKEIADIKEADIRTAARRNAIKEGVRLATGLRRIPISSAQALGLDMSKVRTVEFKKSEKAPPKEGTAVTIVDMKSSPVKSKKTGKVYTKFTFKDSTGFECSTIDENLAEEGRIAKDNVEKIILVTEKTDYGYTLKGIKSSETQEAA